MPLATPQHEKPLSSHYVFLFLDFTPQFSKLGGGGGARLIKEIGYVGPVKR